MDYKKNVRQLTKKIIHSNKVRYLKIKYPGKKGNFMAEWKLVRNPSKVILTAAVFKILSFFPPGKVKNSFYRLFGVKIGKNVSIAHYTTLDFIFPELITIQDNVIIGSNCEVSVHDFMPYWFTLGRVIIKEGAFIGGHTVIAPGVTIEKKSLIALKSFVKSNIPEGETWGGTPARMIRQKGVD